MPNYTVLYTVVITRTYQVNGVSATNDAEAEKKVLAHIETIIQEGGEYPGDLDDEDTCFDIEEVTEE